MLIIILFSSPAITMTSYRAYTFHIDTTGSKNSKKDIIEKLMKHGEFMTFENEKLNEMRVWLYNADEPPIENKVSHSFTRSSEKYAIDAFMNDLDMNYNFPLNGYITSPSIKTNDEPIITAELDNDDCCYIRYREQPNFPFTTFDVYNNSSSVILDNEFPDDFLMRMLFSTLYSLRRYNVGTIEKCLIRKFNLIQL